MPPAPSLTTTGRLWGLVDARTSGAAASARVAIVESTIPARQAIGIATAGKRTRLRTADLRIEGINEAARVDMRRGMIHRVSGSKSAGWSTPRGWRGEDKRLG